MTDEVTQALQEASVRVEAFHFLIAEAYPELCGSLAIPGMFVGHGLGAFVASGMTDDQIVAQVLAITGQIRGTLSDRQASGAS